MKAYISINYPLNTEEKWYKKLRSSLSDLELIEQRRGTHHITAAFIEELDFDTFDTLHHKVFMHINKNAKAPSVRFDKIDVFLTESKTSFVVYLTSTDCSELQDYVEGLRDVVTECNCEMSSYRTHVTLFRVPTTAISLDELHDRIRKIGLVPFTVEAEKTEVCEYVRNNKVTMP